MDRPEIAGMLADARIRTLLLISPLEAGDLQVQHSPLMSPIVWDLGHIAHFEELWLVQNIGPDPQGRQFGEIPGIYNPFENPRSVRGKMQLPTPRETVDVMAGIRRKVLDHLALVDLCADDRLLRDGFVFHMVAQHEYQHDETVLQTLQLKQGAPYPAPRGWTVPERPGERPEGPERPDGMVRFDGGDVVIGTSTHAAAYDNERPAHMVRVEPFEIEVTPVTNAAFAEFVEAGGYRERGLWNDEGWAWISEHDVATPMYWTRGADGWTTRTMDREHPLEPDHPVCHVTWHEANAYARWAGKRLPTEAEWETAATWDPSSGTKRVFPWGDEPATHFHANVDQLSFGTAPVGAYPLNVSPLGCHGMIGDVWEWTASDFVPWSGYETFPYREYSEVFFGSDYKVLKGGSWATRPGAIRGTFRNWDYPIRRQIFSGFRCARDP